MRSTPTRTIRRLRTLLAGGFAPPSLGDVDRNDLRELVRRGHVVQRDGIGFHRDAIDAAAFVAAELLAEHVDGFTVAQFRDATGASRKYALPLVAELDARGMTTPPRRSPDRRPATSTSLSSRVQVSPTGMWVPLEHRSPGGVSVRVRVVSVGDSLDRRLGRHQHGFARLAVVLGGAFERLDLERDAVDGGTRISSPTLTGVARLVRARQRPLPTSNRHRRGRRRR